MSTKTNAKVSYKIFTGVVLSLCGLHLIFFSSFFEVNTDDTGVSNVNREEYPIKLAKKPSQINEGDDNDTSPVFKFNFITWPQQNVQKVVNKLFEDWHFWWISSRLQNLWPEFEQFGAKIKGKCGQGRSAKKILILPGVLMFTNFASPNVIKNGGSLGELTQWSDLITGCLALCHHVDIRTDFRTINARLRSSVSETDVQGCSDDGVDLIFTDITGIKKLSPDVIKSYKHKFRILDVYGTEAAYNDPSYSGSHELDSSRWGLLDLHLKQFYTMFPHTPDNSFLGFVVPSDTLSDLPKQNFTLILGKDASYLRGKMELLRTVHEVFPIAATLHPKFSDLVPEGSFLLGIIDPAEYRNVLAEAKVCLGLGDPIESPSPLLSMAAGCIFLNPEKNQTLFGKPTGRIVTSQNVYMERYFRPPRVYTYDPGDLEKLKQILQEIVDVEKVEPIIPRAFTVHGYLDRLENKLLAQNFCTPSHSSFDHSSGRYFLAKDSSDCNVVCYRQGLICEPDHFAYLNHASTLERLGLQCKRTSIARDLYTPAYDRMRKECLLQPDDKPLFSCTGKSTRGVGRVCPCAADHYGEEHALRKTLKLKGTANNLTSPSTRKALAVP